MLKEQNLENKSQALQLEDKNEHIIALFLNVLFVVSGSGLFHFILNFWIRKNKEKNLVFFLMYTQTGTTLVIGLTRTELSHAYPHIRYKSVWPQKLLILLFFLLTRINSDCYSYLQPFYYSGVLAIQITLPKFPWLYTDKNDTFCIIWGYSLISCTRDFQ